MNQFRATLGASFAELSRSGPFLINLNHLKSGIRQLEAIIGPELPEIIHIGQSQISLPGLALLLHGNHNRSPRWCFPLTSSSSRLPGGPVQPNVPPHC